MWTIYRGKEGAAERGEKVIRFKEIFLLLKHDEINWPHGILRM